MLNLFAQMVLVCSHVIASTAQQCVSITSAAGRRIQLIPPAEALAGQHGSSWVFAFTVPCIISKAFIDYAG
jgi:hypothetical protein